MIFMRTSILISRITLRPVASCGMHCGRDATRRSTDRWRVHALGLVPTIFHPDFIPRLTRAGAHRPCSLGAHNSTHAGILCLIEDRCAAALPWTASRAVHRVCADRRARVVGWRRRLNVRWRQGAWSLGVRGHPPSDPEAEERRPRWAGRVS